MSFEDLSPELQEKAKACKTREELVALAESVGVKLSDDELDAVAGGSCRKHCQGKGGICINDTQCLTNVSCPQKSLCPTFSECTEQAPCTENVGPIPFECTTLNG